MTLMAKPSKHLPTIKFSAAGLTRADELRARPTEPFMAGDDGNARAMADALDRFEHEAQIDAWEGRRRWWWLW